MEIFSDLNKEGKTIIIATHDKHIVDQMNRRVIAFRDKKVLSDRENGEYSLEI